MDFANLLTAVPDIGDKAARELTIARMAAAMGAANEREKWRAKATDDDLHPDAARKTARTAIGYSQAFDGKNTNWQSGEPWPHRIELAQALDWIIELGAIVLNLADRVPAGCGCREGECKSKPAGCRMAAEIGTDAH